MRRGPLKPRLISPSVPTPTIDYPKNKPLTTALLFGFRFVTLITTLPVRFHERYSPPWNELSVSVSRTVPVAASMIWTSSLRTVLSQSTAYSETLCTLPSVRFRLKLSEVLEYHVAAIRPVLAEFCRPRRSVVLPAQV